METKQTVITYPSIEDATHLKGLESMLYSSVIEVSTFLRNNAFNISTLDWKERDDPVTDLDKTAERMIREGINQWSKSTMYNVPVKVYGEEYGVSPGESPIAVYIDPIDGTKSFIQRQFNTSISVALEYKGTLRYGIVSDFMRGIIYVASEMSHDGNPLAYLSHASMPKPLGLPINKKQLLSKICLQVNTHNKAAKMLRQIPDVSIREQAGSIALSMAQVAAGCFDGMLLEPYKKKGPTDTADIAAGCYLMKQAGFVMSDYAGHSFDHKDPHQGLIVIRPELADRVFDFFGKNR